VRYDFVAKVLAAVQRNGMRKVGFVNTVELAQ
jgi:biopolymer transport protein ExbD